PHRLTQNSQATLVTRLRLYESAIASRFGFSRKIRSPATLDFCNRIGPSQSIRNVRPYGEFRRVSGHGADIAKTTFMPEVGDPNLLCGSGRSFAPGLIVLSDHHRADPPHSAALPRPRHERPRGCASDEADKFAPSH